MTPFAAMRLKKTGAPPTDPDFASVVWLLHGEGANGGTTFVDSSSYEDNPTRSGTATTISAAQAKFGSASILCNSGGIVSSTNARYSAGTGAFTFETWWFCTTLNGTNPTLVDSRMSASFGGEGFVFDVSGGSTLNMQLQGAANVATTLPSLGAWHHIAMSRSGTSVYHFIDGALISTQTSSANISTTILRLGRSYNSASGSACDMWFDDTRYTVGVCRYTADFAPPAAQFADA